MIFGAILDSPSSLRLEACEMIQNASLSKSPRNCEARCRGFLRSQQTRAFPLLFARNIMPMLSIRKTISIRGWWPLVLAWPNPFA